MGTRVEQTGEFLPCASRAGRRHTEGMADSLHRLSSAAEDLQVIISRRNRALLLQGEFCITLREFQENQRGVSFKTLLIPYLRGAAQITITDPYIRQLHQARDLMELIEGIAATNDD